MPERDDWQIPQGMRPDSRALSFDLGRALSAIVWLNATVPDDAFTARVLGTERGGSGVIIDDNMVLTIGYLVTEAEQVWLSAAGGPAVPGSVLAYDQETGFGLITALGKLDLPALPLGSSAAVETGTPLIVAGHGGEARALAARSIAVEPFAGYWEYLIDGAIFTAPAYPNWSGAAAIDQAGELIGVGSLHVERSGDNGRAQEVNMFVPAGLLTPILGDLVTLGRSPRPPRPWLGLYIVEHEGKLVVAGLAGRGPAHAAGRPTPRGGSPPPRRPP